MGLRTFFFVKQYMLYFFFKTKIARQAGRHIPNIKYFLGIIGLILNFNIPTPFNNYCFITFL